ncbi:hypothetical protein L227DRAFT_578000 [Lentinus tigrinus ALCF2SS1-6]|uniref:F-box domain-containing protein n=1 Tax=Lentinus tigrinus ALCF2SS1-6 TaxID=1328759 RepID=A0A5C2S3H9_9APHY|nr:hypothetical protein L227DRAFT_578000 [Lentinus tigrinus ALCF2SS1-6]
MQSATLSVLASPDLLANIFSRLRLFSDYFSCSDVDAPSLDDIEEEHRNLRRTLYSAALVCRAFSPYALDELWRSLDGFTPLLSLLEPLVFDEHEKHWLFHRAVEAEEWQRFELYSRRVCFLKYDGPIERDVHSSVWVHIRGHYRNASILPRLQLRYTYVGCRSGVYTPESGAPPTGHLLRTFCGLSRPVGRRSRCLSRLTRLVHQPPVPSGPVGSLYSHASPHAHYAVTLPVPGMRVTPGVLDGLSRIRHPQDLRIRDQGRRTFFPNRQPPVSTGVENQRNPERY